MSWIDGFSELASLDESVVRLLESHGAVLQVPADTVIFEPGKQPDNLILLLKGSVRVQQFSEGGREIVLYRIQPGESCVLTTACLLGAEEYTAQAITENEVAAVAIPRTVFSQLLVESSGFRNFVFRGFSKRMMDLFLVIEEVAFKKVDVRLAQKIIELAGENFLVSATHHQLAIELGTAREVISRQLKEFQRRNWIEQSRGSIVLIDKNSLLKLIAA